MIFLLINVNGEFTIQVLHTVLELRIQLVNRIGFLSDQDGEHCSGDP